MKNIFTSIIIFLSVLSFSQSICDDAYLINTLPFNATGVNTFYADADTSGNYCNASGIAANDTIFSYTPSVDQNVDISLSNVQIQYNFLVEMFLFEQCPDAVGATCLESATGSVYEISNVNLIAGVTYYIVITNTNVLGVTSFIFDINIKARASHDIEVVHFTQTRSDCSLGSPYQEVSFDVRNVGIDTIFGYKMIIDLNGHTDSVERPNDTLLVNQQKTIFYYTDMSIDDYYYISVYPKYDLDLNPENDTLKLLVHNLGEVNTFPFISDFEDTSLWVAEWTRYYYDYPFWSGEQTSWQWGEPNATIINSAAEGTKAMVTNLTGNCYQNDKSFLLSPCFDFTNVSIPVIEFDMWRNLDTAGAAWIEYTLTDGDVWVRLGTTNSGTNWYNEFLGHSDNKWLGNTNGWVKAKHRIEALSGVPHVYFRFVFENHSSNIVEGFAIDNIRVFEAPNKDVGVQEILSPQSFCGLGNDSIKVLIKNFSPDSIHTGFDIKYVINDGAEVIETVTDTVQPDNTLVYTFSTTFDFSNSAEYKIFATTMLANDDDLLNNADSTVIISFDNYTSFPYSNDFETDNGQWYYSGVEPSWAWGEPTDTVINAAFSGTKIWATNLLGYHNSPEDSYITSSCFSISAMKRPFIKFQAMYDLYLLDGVSSSYVQILSSQDNGATWNTLGTSSDANWYNTGSSWTGRVDDWTQMIRPISDLNVTDKVQFRFKLWALEDKTGFAFDDFEICDAPIAGFDFVASSGEVAFNDTSINGETYEWIFNDGQTSNLQNPTMNFVQDTIQAKLIVTNACFTDTITQIIYTVGVDELAEANIHIYPNPVVNQLIISNQELAISNIEIYDITGKRIKTQQVGSKNIIIDTSNWENGMYLIHLKVKNATFVKKIIK